MQTQACKLHTCDPSPSRSAIDTGRFVRVSFKNSPVGLSEEGLTSPALPNHGSCAQSS